MAIKWATQHEIIQNLLWVVRILFAVILRNLDAGFEAWFPRESFLMTYCGCSPLLLKYIARPGPEKKLVGEPPLGDPARWKSVAIHLLGDLAWESRFERVGLLWFS